MKFTLIFFLLSLTFALKAQDIPSSVSPFCEGSQVQEFERMDAMANSYWWAKIMTISPDNRLIAIANQGGYGSIQILDAQTLSVLHVIPENPLLDTRLFSLSWSPDSKFLAVGTFAETGHEPSSAKEIKIWDIESLELLIEIQQVEPVQIIWSADSSKLAVLEIYGNLSIWNTTTADLITELDSRALYGIIPQILLWIMDERFLIAIDGTYSKMIIWDIESNDSLVRESAAFYWPNSAAWNPHSNILTLGGRVGLIWLEDFPDNLPSATISTISELPTPIDFDEIPNVNFGGYIFDTAWSPDGSTLAAGTSYGLVLIDAETQEVTLYIGDGYPEFAQIEWFSDSNTLAAFTRYGVLFTWDIANECLLAVVEASDLNNE